jgi:MFS transporter, DHA1 family, multidrug resistance protein
MTDAAGARTACPYSTGPDANRAAAPTGPRAVPGDGTGRLVRTLAATTFLLWLGASAILPLLPAYLRQRGGSDAMVGVVMASYFAASLIGQYPAGILADRVGRKPVLLGGLVVYAAGSLGFLLGVGSLGDAAFRALQGFGAGSAEVASLAFISGGVALEQRGRAFGAIYGAQLAGMAVGPLTGSLIGVSSMNVIFVGAAAAALAAAVPIASSHVLAVEEARAGAQRDLERRGLPEMHRALVGALFAAAAFGLVIGVYEACWTLLLEQRGAQQWQIGLSWTLFAVPFVVMSRPAGWLADHFDRRVLAVGATSVSIFFCALYPFIHQVALLLALGAVEAIGTAIALPATQSLLAQSSHVDEVGRVQGLFSTSETAAVAVSAAIGGFLFARADWMPFVAASIAAAMLVACLPFIWAPVAGRASEAGGPHDVLVAERPSSESGVPRRG